MIKDSYILIGMHRIVKDLDRETLRICTANGMTLAQFMVLEALYHKDGMSVGEIKEAILSSDGTIPVIINNLAKSGLVSKTKDPEDARRSVVCLTEEGRARIEKVMPENTKMFEEKFGAWSDEDKRAMIKLLEKYRQASR